MFYQITFSAIFSTKVTFSAQCFLTVKWQVIVPVKKLNIFMLSVLILSFIQGISY